MPTGFTAPLYDGEDITPRDLALQFARGMSFTIMQRDEPLSEPPRLRELSDYYVRQVNEAEQRVEWLQSAHNYELRDEQLKRRQEIIEANTKSSEEHERLSGVYTAAINVFNKWRPATEAGQGVKRFALEQLRHSLEFDAGEPYVRDVPEVQPVASYRAEELVRAEQALERAEERLDEERQRVHEFNVMIQDALTDIERLRDVQW